MHIQNPTAVVAQLVEHQLPKLRVAGSNPVYRSKRAMATIDMVAINHLGQDIEAATHQKRTQ